MVIVRGRAGKNRRVTMDVLKQFVEFPSWLAAGGELVIAHVSSITIENVKIQNGPEAMTKRGDSFCQLVPSAKGQGAQVVVENMQV